MQPLFVAGVQRDLGRQQAPLPQATVQVQSRLGERRLVVDEIIQFRHGIGKVEVGGGGFRGIVSGRPSPHKRAQGHST